jgi:hypothetical protein
MTLETPPFVLQPEDTVPLNLDFSGGELKLLLPVDIKQWCVLAAGLKGKIRNALIIRLKGTDKLLELMERFHGYKFPNEESDKSGKTNYWIGFDMREYGTGSIGESQLKEEMGAIGLNSVALTRIRGANFKVKNPKSLLEPRFPVPLDDHTKKRIKESRSAIKPVIDRLTEVEFEQQVRIQAQALAIELVNSDFPQEIEAIQHRLSVERAAHFREMNAEQEAHERELSKKLLLHRKKLALQRQEHRDKLESLLETTQAELDSLHDEMSLVVERKGEAESQLAEALLMMGSLAPDLREIKKYIDRINAEKKDNSVCR